MFLPGKRLHFAKKNMAIEIVDIPIKKWRNSVAM